MVAQTIKINETKNQKGCHKLIGRDHEISCYQLLPSTYRAYSIQVLGYVAEATPINVEYITTMKVQKLLEKNSPKDILLKWNAGEGAKSCSQGTNSRGTPYNSCSYVTKGMEIYKQLTLN